MYHSMGPCRNKGLFAAGGCLTGGRHQVVVRCIIKDDDMNQFYVVRLCCCPLYARTASFPPLQLALTATVPVYLTWLYHLRLGQTANLSRNPTTYYMAGRLTPGVYVTPPDGRVSQASAAAISVRSTSFTFPADTSAKTLTVYQPFGESIDN